VVWNLEKAANWAKDILQKADVATFGLDADVLLAHAINRPRRFVFTYPDYQIPLENLEVFQKLIFRRAKREPIHYILNNREFWSLEFFVNSNVLIPRPETEHLIDHFLELARSQKNEQRSLEVLDIGVGSGNISIAVLKELPLVKVTAIDISEDALEVAKRNAKNHDVLNRIQFCLGDLFPKGDLFPDQFDFVLSNPPYIASSEFDSLEPEITCFEPKVALISGKTGLEVYERLISETLLRLKFGGYLILEIGDGQLEQIKNLIDQSGEFAEVFTVFDYAGKPRTISARRKING
jgi:release factor glutamine methyltransferase